MTSNIPWANQFEGSGGLNSADNSWNRGGRVNTPQTNPASWPQLGAPPPEQEPLQAGMSPAQLKPQEDTGWGSGPPLGSAPKDPDPNGTSGWGRLSDGAGPAASSGWGVPSNAAWGQQTKTSVDDGTAVWSKSGSTQSQGAGWGGSTGQIKDTGSSGWGAPADVSANLSGTANLQTSDSVQQVPLQSNVSSSASGSQTTSSNPVSWAKAASVGLPSSGGSESPPAESETDQTENSGGTTPLPPPPPPPETDPVQQIVNSHEGWGTKPIHQGTSWNIGGTGTGAPRPATTISNGTEAWGKSAGAQMQTTQSWGDSSNSKPAAGWGGSYSQPQQVQPGNWGAPSQTQQSRPIPSAGTSGVAGWGDPPQQAPGVANTRWNDVPGQMPVTPTNWGNQLPQQNSVGWGGVQPDTAGSSNWGTAQNTRHMQPGSSWGGNAMPPNVVDQNSWGRQADPLTRRPSTVDNGTSAWGDPGDYSKVNMWDKNGPVVGTTDTMAAQMGANVNNENKGWGVPPAQSNPVANIPPSPKGWGEVSPTRPNTVDNGTSHWGAPKLGAEKWDKNPSNSNWNGAVKPGGGWGQTNDQQWGQNDVPSGWAPPMGKVSLSHFSVLFLVVNLSEVLLLANKSDSLFFAVVGHFFNILAAFF